MKNKGFFKKLATAAFAAMMVMGMSLSADASSVVPEATGVPVDNTQVGKLTIHKYKMVDTQNAFDSNTASGGEEVQTLPADAEPLGGVSFRITKVDLEGAVDASWTAVVGVTDTSGVINVSDLPLGRYKVEELGILAGSGHDQAIPNLDDPAMDNNGRFEDGIVTTKSFLVDIPMTASDGSTLNYDVHVYPKNEVLSVDKYVTYVENKDDTFNMGDVQTWIINASIPGNIAINGENGEVSYAAQYKITDELDTQLDYEGEVVVRLVQGDQGGYAVLKDGTGEDLNLTAGTDYTLTQPAVGATGGTLVVELTDAGKALAKEAINRATDPAVFVQVRFNTSINESAALGTAIPNGAQLDFANSYAEGKTISVEVPDGDGKYADGRDFANEPDERPEVHTSKVTIRKIGEDEEKDGVTTPKLLEGVEFMIFADEAKAKAAVEKVQDENKTDAEIENLDGALEVYDGGQFTKTVTTDSTGIAQFIGLAYYTNKPAGPDGNLADAAKGDTESKGVKTYYLVETKTKEGYQLPSEYYPVEVSQTTALSTDPNYEIKNNPQALLPKTGGIGTIIFTTGGLLLMVLAGILLVVSRKKEQSNS